MRDKYDKIGNIFAIMVICLNLICLWGFYSGITAVFVAIGIINLCIGPICLIAYVKEIRKGVFRIEDEEDNTDNVVDAP